MYQPAKKEFDVSKRPIDDIFIEYIIKTLAASMTQLI